MVDITTALAKRMTKAARKFLLHNGITVLRFWNHQVRCELVSVLKAIWFALQQRASKPSP